MVTECLNLGAIAEFARQTVLDILSRMGWAYDLDPEDNNFINVNIPIDDTDMFDFIFDGCC